MTGLMIRKDGIEREAVYPPNATVLEIAEAVRQAKREIDAELKLKRQADNMLSAARRGDVNEVARLAAETVSRQCRRRHHKRCRQLNCGCECHQ